MPKIKSIQEAFSCQPKYLELNVYETYYDKKNACQQIVLETRRHSQETIDYYVGYNYDGVMIFAYRADTVNVHYEAE